MSYRIAGIDVHKKMLAVVVSDVEVDGEFRFERRMFGSNPEQLRTLAAWLLEPEVGNAAFSAGAIQSRAAGTQEGFPRCRTPSEAAGGPRVDSEFCARCRATSVANSDAEKIPVDARSGAAAEPIGVSSRRGTHQVVQPGLGHARCQCPAHAEGAG